MSPQVTLFFTTATVTFGQRRGTRVNERPSSQTADKAFLHKGQLELDVLYTVHLHVTPFPALSLSTFP
ncbi:hypothetical protein TGRH88_034530 [Toxoplasma gondii]|uniref:Uncharacterized protein n=1 Tax=Toxoplasma gondii TaxID=5811 RepID=A0A7J6K6M6_TOXGO|nr:hypothetical protein TGRH88_034530 [Toxoplasma gondii]